MCVMKLSSAMIAQWDELARQRFMDELRDTLFEHHDDIPLERREELFLATEDECQKLGIETEYGLTAFFVLSFAFEMPLSFKAGYMALHRDFLRRFESPERLPIEIYDRAT